MVCPRCGDTGWAKTMIVVTCPLCNGAGKINKDKCTRCHGAKVVTEMTQEPCLQHDNNYKDR
jgi:DnaJ-class molecular chaperone